MLFCVFYSFEVCLIFVYSCFCIFYSSYNFEIGKLLSIFIEFLIMYMYCELEVFYNLVMGVVINVLFFLLYVSIEVDFFFLI